MFLHLTGIKNISEKNYTLDCLVECDEILKAKVFLSEEKIVTLGLDEYKEDPKNFGDVFADIKGKSGDVVRFISNFENVGDYIKHLVKLKFDVIKVGSYTRNLDEESMKQIIASAVKQEQEREELIKKKKEEQERKNKLTYSDGKLLKAYSAIDQVVEQIDQLMAIGGDTILPETRKKFNDMRGEIAKLRLATNLDKIIDELHSALNLIVDTQDYLLGKLNDEKIYSVVPGSQITNIEIIREESRLFKSRLLSTLGASLSTEESTYASMGYLKPFLEYLRKDISFGLKNKIAIVQGLFGGAELLVLFILLETVILSTIGDFVGINLSLQRYGIIFIYLAILGRLFRIVNSYIRPKTVLSYALYFVGILVLYLAIMYAIKTILVF